MRPGPPPKPTALKILAGNPGEHALNKREPRPPPGIPECPKKLPKKIKAKWLELAPLLIESHLLSKLDIPAFVLLLRHLVRIDETARKVERSGLLVKAKNGFPVVSPLLYVLNRAQRDAMRIMAEFGLTPSSRSRIVSERGPGNVLTGNERFFRKP
jgi:P27 family predicted phage terminase small subunit